VEPDAPQVRAAEVVGAVSLATDLGTGQPLEHTLRTAILAVRLGDLAGASPQELRDAYYVSLLHSFGCTSDAPEATELYGDDIVPRAAFALVDGGNLGAERRRRGTQGGRTCSWPPRLSRTTTAS
jgi:hypothetical protein